MCGVNGMELLVVPVAFGVKFGRSLLTKQCNSDNTYVMQYYYCVCVYFVLCFQSRCGLAQPGL